MMDKLASIGFYTLRDERARTSSVSSPLHRCELLLTSRCNFNCPYCRKRAGPDIDQSLASAIVLAWMNEGLKNIRFSGGEPTLYKPIFDLIYIARRGRAEHIAISTNGSASQETYEHLLTAGVNDFSVSLDACCSATGDTMSGVQGHWKQVIQNIQFLAARTYTTVGIVLTDANVREARETILLAESLGVSDIRIIPAAQVASVLPSLDLPKSLLGKYPILKYRISSYRPVRGLFPCDNPRCPLVLDDMAMDENGFHYPCIIYMRERGSPIGQFNGDIRQVRDDRLRWSEEHDCFSDPICKGNCLDVCIAYNNRWRELRT